MGVPLLICYTVDDALRILGAHKISNVVITNTGAYFGQRDDKGQKRVIDQRNKNTLIELIVC